MHHRHITCAPITSCLRMLLFTLTGLLALSPPAVVAEELDATPAPAPASAGVSAAGPAAEPELPPLSVSYVGADAIYLDGGRSHGLTVGQHVAVVREGKPIAELQVAFVSKRSASCRVVDSRREVILGDQAIPIARLEPDPEAEAPQVAEASPQPEPSAEDQPRSRNRRGSGGGDAWGDLSGTISLRWHRFNDGGEVPRDFDQTGLRLNLRAKSIAGTPYQAGVRVRGREDRRYRVDEPTVTERNDRLYELALIYEPPEGRLAFQVGRLGSSPLLGFYYLDGGLVEYRVKPRFWVGGFYGQRSDVDELGLGSSGLAYGAFVHYKKKRAKDAPLGGAGAAPSALPQHVPAVPLDAEAAARAAELETRLAEGPGDLPARKELALLLLRNDQLTAAFEQASEILRERSDDPDGLYVQGTVRLVMGQAVLSLRLLDRLVAHYPNHVPGMIVRGKAQRRIGDETGARRSWEQALALETLRGKTGGRVDELERLLGELPFVAPQLATAHGPVLRDG